MKKILLSLAIITLFSLSNLAYAKETKDVPNNKTPEKSLDKEDKKSDDKEEKKPENSENKEVKNDPMQTLKLLDQFGDVFEKIRKDYVEEVADKKILESAINGMLTSLDPHSSFLNKEDFKEMQEQTKGEFGGLGIEVTLKNGLVYVVAPIDDTPAFKAGIKAGDYISHIDGKAVYGLSISDAVKMMRGKPQTKVTLKIVREGEKKPLKKVLTRDIIKVKSVKSKEYKDVVYIRISSFTDNTGQNMVDEIAKLTKKIGKEKVKGIVLDLRNNPGGLLNEAINVSDAFLNQGEIVSTKGRHLEESQKYSATYGDVTNNLPIVVVINGGSASASEIVSGALQDQKRAIIIGEKSFGKGSVQTVIPISSDSAIRLTTSRYYTPSGNSIQAKGITPDIEVKQAKIQLEEPLDRTKEADLNGHLTNDKDSTADKKDEKKDDFKIDEDLKKKLFDKTKKEDEEDYQLQRALDLVRALYIYGKK
jgi:carboxyl-terminal processing protease